ncbi:hypothetical protein HRbin28_02076 [bacterium HR28]|nr:hypothetical protein HRbin28_02076 [bacterium HR28]
MGCENVNGCAPDRGKHANDRETRTVALPLRSPATENVARISGVPLAVCDVA